ncbi:hypothetical protein Vretimale_7852 [Volvox reticuliferus]|nr:hypothetical protein Vretimale_7852 [Volvox reticuliferus]
MGAYPDYFKPEWFSWESYLWAAELWYSYGIQVQLSNGNICTCLAPYLGLMNHHPLPHIVHFSKVDPQTGCLRVRAFRSCAPGCQLFLSYGPYSNAKLLLFYGFALKDNPADEVDLVLQVPSGPTATDRRAVLAAAGLPLEQRLRAGGRIAPAVLACARLLAAPPEILKQLRRVPPSELKARLAAPGSTEAEAEAMRMLVDAIDALLCPARECARRLQMAEGDKANLTSDSTQRQDAAAAPPSLGSERVSLATGTDGDGRVGAELRHFARLYVDGLIQILEDSRAAVSRAMEMAGACA